MKPITTLCILTYQEGTLVSKLEKYKIDVEAVTFLISDLFSLRVLLYLPLEILTYPTLT